MAINFDHQLNKITTGNSDIDFDITGSLRLPVGTTAQRTGTLTGGEVRFNSTNNLFEGYNGTDWLSLGALEDNTIGSLQDVDTTGITTGQVLKWNGTTFVAADDIDTTLVLANQSVGDLGDVDLTGIQSGQVLKWNGSSFVASDDQEDLSDNTTDDLAEGVTNLYYTDGRVDTRIGATSIDALNDVDTTTAAPSDGQSLVWNAAQSKWLPGTVSGGGGGGGISEGDAIAFAIALGS